MGGERAGREELVDQALANAESNAAVILSARCSSWRRAWKAGLACRGYGGVCGRCNRGRVGDGAFVPVGTCEQHKGLLMARHAFPRKTRRGHRDGSALSGLLSMRSPADVAGKDRAAVQVVLGKFGRALWAKVLYKPIARRPRRSLAARKQISSLFLVCKVPPTWDPTTAVATAQASQLHLTGRR